jgi:hypothetical protein
MPGADFPMDSASNQLSGDRSPYTIVYREAEWILSGKIKRLKSMV